METPDLSGKVTRTRTVRAEGRRHRVMTAYAPGPDGKKMQVMKITYMRRR